MTDEYLDAMQSLWYDEHPEYHGRFVDFAGIDAHPRPLQRPIPLVVAGHSPPAYRRAITRAHGWYGYSLTPEDVADSLPVCAPRRIESSGPGARRARDQCDAPRSDHA